MRTLALCFIFLFANQSQMIGQVDDADETCCDFDSNDYVPGLTCQLNGSAGNFHDPGGDGFVGDCDCSDVDPSLECIPIPLGSGLSFLALAGGGLATVAMRRRRQEDEEIAERALN